MDLYSAIFPYGPGIKPGTTKPTPFSIQIATKRVKQETEDIPKLLRKLWIIQVIVANKSSGITVQIPWIVKSVVQSTSVRHKYQVRPLL